MNWVDLVVVTVLFLSAVLAFMRGFVREVLGIGAWIGAALFAAWGGPELQPRMRQWIANPSLADPAALAAAFVVALIVLSVVAGVIGGIVRGSALGSVDRTLGVLFGLVRGAALIVFAYIGAGMVVPPEHWPDAVKESQAPQFAYQGARWAAELLPPEYRPGVQPPPSRRETRAEDLLHATPQGRAFGHP